MVAALGLCKLNSNSFKFFSIDLYSFYLYMRMYHRYIRVITLNFVSLVILWQQATQFLKTENIK